MKAISGRRMGKILEAIGWVLDRVHGSHFVYRNPATGETISVPVHANRDLATGTQRGLMKRAGIAESDL